MTHGLRSFALIVALATPLEARTVLLDGSRGLSPEGGFDAYQVMETFMVARGFTVVRSTEPVSSLDLSGVDLILLTSDWMADGAHPENDRMTILDFVKAGGDLIVLVDVPGAGTEALNQVTEPLGIPCGRTSAAGGRIQVTDHPTVRDISGLTFPEGSSVEATENAQLVASNQNETPVIAVREALPGVLIVLGARIWRNDLWDANREDVLRRTLGWLSDPTPVRTATWGGVKLGVWTPK